MTTVSWGDERLASSFAAGLAARRKSARSLAKAVESAVEQVDGAALISVARSNAPPFLQAKTLLGLLSYCYARQVYSSKAIAAQLRRDFQFESLEGAGNELPDELILKRFRDQNRGPLDFCLKSALLFLGIEKVRQGMITHVSEANIARDASRRIIMAMFIDSMEKEAATDAVSARTFRFPGGRPTARQ